MNKTISKIPDWLRWLLLVPAIICYVIASYYSLNGLFGTIQINSWIYTIVIIILLFFVSGFIIPFAAYIAPKDKLLVSLIFAAIILLFCVFMFIFYSLQCFIIFMLGAIVSLIIVIKKICNKKRSKQSDPNERIVTKKRNHHLLLAVCIFILIVAAGSLIMYIVNTVQIPAALFINGKEIANERARIRYEDTVLPFTEVLKGAGFNVKWRDNNIAEFTYEDKTYILNIQDATLVEEGFDCDGLLCPPGNRHGYQKAEGRELYVDENTIFCTIYDFGKIMNIDIDRGKLIVYVTLRNY